jgi:transposase-like protein
VKLTLAELRKRVQDEHDAYVMLETLRWGADGERLTCPHCGNGKAYFLNPKGGARGTGKPKADGKRTQSVRRVWKCASCRKQFSVLTGTIFHGTKVSIADWLTVMVLMCSAKNGISAREVERLIGVTPETAWFMLHRLREAMKREPLVGMMSGTIVADEAYIGGRDSNKHRQGTYGEAKYKGGKGRPASSKTPIVSLVNTDTGEVRSQVVADVTGATLRKVISEQVEMETSILHTDGNQPYVAIGEEFYDHQSVDHGATSTSATV